MPLLDALQQRHSSRNFSTRELAAQTLSNLLWAACGVNRPDIGGRTAPSTRNWREIEVFVATASGLYVYEPIHHELIFRDSRDVRSLTGNQDFVAQVPLDLVYVADLDRIHTEDDQERRFYSAADAAFIAQNVYLYCASQGLSTVVRGLVDRQNLARAIGLSSHQRVLLTQSVGHRG
jgi:nitroreductase